VDVTLVESSERLGGKVLTQDVAGHRVDAGPDALLLRVPAMRTLLEDLGLDASVVAPGAPGAFVYSRGRLRALPPSTLFGVPHRLLPLLRSRLLSPAGVARAALDLVLPRRDAGDDPSVGALLRPRFGSQVFDRLVDPLLGGVHAGRADVLSARSAVPEIDRIARSGRSLYLTMRRRPAPDASAGPALVTLEGGLSTLVDALAAAHGGADVELGAAAESLMTAEGDGRPAYVVRLADGRELDADAVVLATPAPVTAGLLAAIAPAAAAAAAAIPYADVATITLVYPHEAFDADAASPRGTGFLVPPEEGLLLVGCSWLSVKWPQLADASVVLVRAMVGRFGDRRFADLDDRSLVDRVHGELVTTMGLALPPKEAHVQRWPSAMPQYTVGHQARLDRLDAALADLPGVVVTGSAYRGVGVASCVSQAQRTATDLLDGLGVVAPLADLAAAPSGGHR
jgi:oxygen-dependent protoporphyrinogen oxidase